MSKQNAAFMENAMRMFSPFADQEEAADAKQANGEESSRAEASSGAAAAADQDSLDDLKRKIDDLQKQIETISDKK